MTSHLTCDDTAYVLYERVVYARRIDRIVNNVLIFADMFRSKQILEADIAA